MSFSCFVRILLVAVFAFSGVPWNLSVAQVLPVTVNIEWLPVTDAERRMNAPVVEPGAGVEALFWHVHVLDELMGDEWQRVLYHYVRLKIFNDEGMKTAATTDIEYGDKESILSIDGRTIKPDGSIVDLDKSAIHERDLVRVGRLKRKVKSFAMPGVEVGAIVEYRWREIRHEPRSLYMRLQFQREFPVQKVTYYIKPLSRDYTTYRMGVWPFNCQPEPLKLERDGFNSTFLENVPAFKEEPMMPAEANVRPWMLVYYRDDGKRDPRKYWEEVGKDAYKNLRVSLKVNGEMKQAAAEAVAGASDPGAKVVALIRYVRQNFRGLFDSDVTDAERAKVIKQMPKSRYRTSAEIFSSGIGTADELNTLFAALSSAVGLEARPALVASRNDLYFADSLAERYFLRNIDMAVKLGDDWKLFDVSARSLPPDQLSWFEEGVRALIADSKAPTFITTPVSSPETSGSTRVATLTLGDDGSLEGDVEETLTGHAAAVRRGDFTDESEARQQEEVKDELVETYPQAEVTGIRVKNADDPEQPLVIGYHIRVPSYARRTGTRLFLQPLYFQYGSAPTFTAGERMYDIHFRHAWKDTDRVTITLPDGYALDNAANPGSMNFGQVGSYDLKMGLNGSRELVCVREFVFGNEGILLFPKTAYGQIKSVFDEIHRRDTHILSVRKAGL